MLAACSPTLTSDEWHPAAPAAACRVRIQLGTDETVTGPIDEVTVHYDAAGRVRSGTARPSARSRAWERFGYDDEGRVIDIRAWEDVEATAGKCDVIGGCPEPAERVIRHWTIDRDADGRILRVVQSARTFVEEGGDYVLRASRSGERVLPRPQAAVARASAAAFTRDAKGRLRRHEWGDTARYFQSWTYDEGGRVIVHRRGRAGEHGDELREETRFHYAARDQLERVEQTLHIKTLRMPQPTHVYDYTGACAAVRTAPPSPRQEQLVGDTGCLDSPYRVLQQCYWR